MNELEDIESDFVPPIKTLKIDENNAPHGQRKTKLGTTGIMPSYKTTVENITENHAGTCKTL